MRAIPRLAKWILLLALYLVVLMFLLRIVAWWVFGSGRHPFSDTLPALLLGFRYDARMVGIFLLVMLLVGSVPALNPFRSRRAKRGWLVFTGMAFTALVLFYVFDFLHYRYLSQRLNASALAFLEDTKISGDMVWQTYPVLRILVGMVLAVYLLQKICIYLYKKAAGGKRYAPTNRVRAGWLIGLFLVLGLAIFGRVGQYPLRWSDAFNSGSDFNANIALNPFQSFFSSLSFRTSTYDRSKVARYYPVMARYLGVDKPNVDSLNFTRFTPKMPGNTTPPNIVLVICESFSAYKSSMWGNPLNTTPFFNQLSKEGVFFDNCFTPHFGTARGVWATVTGIPDVEFVKTASRNPAMVDQHTIINDFAGYEKFYFLGGSTSWANIRGLLTNNIKDLHLYEEGSYTAAKIDVWGISDKNLFLEANKVLEKQTTPFFAVIQTADNHRPYTIPEEDLGKFKKIELPIDSIRKYGFESNDELNAFRYTDFSYQQFIETARKSPYFNNTIFAFVGDHGIHGNAGDMLPRAWTDNGLTGYHVPMLFYAPRLLQPRRLHGVASQVDMLPTLAGLAQIGYTNTTLGRDLLRDTAMATGREHIAFIVDHNNRNQGIVKDSFYYNRMPSGGKEAFVWADFARTPSAVPADTLKSAYSELTTAFYETARYLLLNNHKR